MPSSGEKVAKTACEQLNPLLKHATAFCELFIFLVSFRDLSTLIRKFGDVFYAAAFIV